jgi:biotin carboxylase
VDRLLLLVPTTSYRVSDFLAAARRLDVAVAVGSERRQVLERYSDGGTLRLDLADSDAGLRQVIDYARRYPLRAIVAADEETTLIAAKAAAALGLPHNPAEAVAACLDKSRFRARLTEAGLPQPRFRLLSLSANSAEAAAAADYPCVLKPLSLSASRGVIRADNPAEFTTAVDRIGRILAASGVRGPAAETILVEDYLPGVEVALEGLLTAGRLQVLALFDKPDPLEGPTFEETLYVTPSRQPTARQAAIARTAAAAAAALGLREGPVHAELRLDADSIWTIEMAARSIGGLCARSLSFGTGLTLEDLILRHALGLPAEVPERERRAAGVMMIPIPGPGVLRGVGGLEAARALPSIREVIISIPRGQAVVPLPEGDRYLGFIFAKAETPAAVEAALRDAHRLLHFDIEP